METIITIFSFLLLLSTFALPFICLKILKTKNRVKSTIIIVATAFLLTVLLAWWNDYSNELLLSHYGFNLDYMSEQEKFAGVKTENLEKAKQLETSIMGIGWPLKAIFGLFFFIPYSILIYFFGTYILSKRRAKNKTS